MPSKKNYPVHYHSDHGDVLRQKIFSEMRKRVLRISGSVVENPLKGYIGYGLDLTRNGRLRKTFLQVEVHVSRQMI